MDHEFEMRRSAEACREAGEHEAALGNEKIADHIRDIECALGAERNLSVRRTEQRDEARALVNKQKRALGVLTYTRIWNTPAGTDHSSYQAGIHQAYMEISKDVNKIMKAE